MRLSILLSVALCLARADTLDYTRQVVIVNSLESGVVGLHSSQDLTRRALDVLRQATYDRTRSVASFLAAHPQAARKFDRVTLENRRGATRFLSDGAVSAEYEFPIGGAVLNLLLPVTGDGRLLGRTACPSCGQAWPEDRSPARGVRLVPFETGSNNSYTGILVDARDLSLAPALFPLVVNEDDQEVIGPGFMAPERLAQIGPVAWYHDRTQAMSSERVGANPLVVRGLRAGGANGCDVVISQYDAARVHGSAANIRLLAECRVGLLTD